MLVLNVFSLVLLALTLDGAACVHVLCRNVHSQLMRHKDEPCLNEVVVVESLRMIAEMVVYGDKKQELLFE